MKKRLNNKFVKLIYVFGLLITICLYVGYLYTHLELLNNEIITLHSTQAEASELTEKKLLNNNIVWRQQIKIDSNGVIKSLKFKLVDIPEDISGILKVSLTGVDGEDYYNTEIPCSALVDGTYYMMSGFTEVELGSINLKVDKRNPIYFNCIAYNLSDEPSFVICRRNNVEPLWIGTEETSGLFLPLEYMMGTQVHYYWVAILCVILFLLTGWGILGQTCILQWCSNVCVLLIPFFALLYGGLLNDNIDYLKTRYGFVSCIIAYIVFFIFQSLVARRIGEVLFLVCSMCIILSNYYLSQFRGQPLMVTDLFSIRTAMTVAESYVFEINFLIVTLFVIAIWLFIIILHSDFKMCSEKFTFTKKKIYGLRAIVICCGFFILFVICYTSNIDLSGWDINDSFSQYGWIYTNTKLCKCYWNISPKVDNREKTEIFIDTESMADDTTEFISPENLIVIMDESFSDLSILGEIETDQELLPYYKSLVNDDKYIEKGWLGVHVLGGGTANTEWEVLTGGNSFFLNIGTLNPYNFLERGSLKYNYTNLCSVAKEAGYETIAMHPLNGRNYSRDKIYSLFGFDDYKNIDNYYQDAKFIRWCVSDDSDMDGIIDQYKNKKNEKLFIFNVTIQNHGSFSYPMDSYPVHYKDGKSNELNSYFSLINETDQALEKILSYFSTVKEPTMIVFFGDHQPTLPDVFYEDVLKTKNPSEFQNEMKHVTPYLIWSNYERKTCNKPYINAGYLSAIIKYEAGLELNKWDRYLLHVMDKYPVIGKYGIFDSSYQFYSYSDLKEEDKSYLKQMKNAQYYWWMYKK